MTAGHSDRRPVRIRRRGRHSSPSQVEKVAQQAGKAAPAVAIAGALVAVPQASQRRRSAAPDTRDDGERSRTRPGRPTAPVHTAQPPAATLDSFATRTVTVAAAEHGPARRAEAGPRYYTVRSGDTLSKIAERFYHKAADWQYLYHENDKTVSDPNLIFAGERLFIPATVPSDYNARPPTRRSTPPRPSRKRPRSTTGSRASSSSHTRRQQHRGRAVGQPGQQRRLVRRAERHATAARPLSSSGRSAGGNPADAFMAAEIAEAESGGNPNAISPTDDYGLWQINASNGALATLNPYGNAKSAITLSDNGSNWNPWTTYHTGAY